VTEADWDVVRNFLDAHTTLTLATVGEAGEPQAADLYYARLDDQAQLCFVSTRSSRHAANIARNPRVAYTVHAVASRWRDIRGVQVEGVCARLAGPAAARAWARYTARFPFVLTDALLGAALAKVDIYAITPRWLRWIDNSVRLGYQVDWRSL
jgi:uncharacterized protein YhbP (UPF0306 family)